VPCAVQDVREPEALVGGDSPDLVARALGVVHRLPAVRERRRCLAGDLTAKDVEVVRDGKRPPLLRRASKLNHPVELGSALGRTSRQAPGTAVQKRQAEARAKPEPIGAEAEISPSEPETLLRNSKALAEPPRPKVSIGQAVPNGHLQAEVLRLVGAPNRLEERVQALCDGPGEDPEDAEAVQDLTEDMRVAAPCRELASFSEKRVRLGPPDRPDERGDS
jgi:hypothetical protein